MLYCAVGRVHKDRRSEETKDFFGIDLLAVNFSCKSRISFRYYRYCDNLHSIKIIYFYRLENPQKKSFVSSDLLSLCTFPAVGHLPAEQCTLFVSGCFIQGFYAVIFLFGDTHEGAMLGCFHALDVDRRVEIAEILVCLTYSVVLGIG